MIFATCGSSDMPFARLMDALSALPADDLYVQHGPAAPPPCAVSRAFMSFGEMVQEIERADLVVSHAGVGSIMCALRAGHVPIVFPRLKQYVGETVDDHQDELAEALASRGTVIVARTAEELVAAVAAAPARSPGRMLAAEQLSGAVRAAIRGEPIPGRTR